MKNKNLSKNFCDWMIEKEYASNCYYTQHHNNKVEGFFIFKTDVEFAGQMLIGYMLEYINYKYNELGTNNPFIYDWRECTIEEIFDGLYLELIMLEGKTEK